MKFVASTVVLRLFACCFRLRLLYKTAEIWYFCTRRGRRNHENDNSYLERPIHLAEQLRVIKQNYISMRLMFKDQSALQIASSQVNTLMSNNLHVSFNFAITLSTHGHVMQSISQLCNYPVNPVVMWCNLSFNSMVTTIYGDMQCHVIALQL